MRRAIPFAVLLAACSAAREVISVGEAGPELPVIDGSAPDVVLEAVAPLACTPETTGASCISSGRCGDAGYAYRCFGGTCPMADSGACFLVAEDPAARTTDTCCERPSCTRVMGPQDHNCIEADAGRYVGWECPAGLTPPGNCVTYGPFVANATLDYCCR